MVQPETGTTVDFAERGPLPAGMSMHKSTVGFERSAGAYERGRPEYPPGAARALLTHCHVANDTRVLELGAGTGKFTGYIAERTTHLLASDPSAAMRASFHAKFPGVLCVGARADAIPVLSGTVQAVICGQAFHWFSDAASVAEIKRVLAPGGFIGMAWNVRDESVAWVAALTDIIDEHTGDTPRYRTGEWKASLAQSPEWGELKFESHRQVVTCDRATLLDRVGSISFIAALDEVRHQKVLAKVNHLLDTHVETRGRTRWDVPYRTDLYWCQKR